MASVFNSKNTQLNLDTDISFTGKWEDLQSYTSVVNTLYVGTDTSGTAYLQWVNTDDDNVPSDDTMPLVTDSYHFTPNQVYTKQFDTRTRWFRLKVIGTGASLNQISTNYKKAPTEVKLSDNNTNIVGVNLGDTKNSLYTVLTDISGSVLGSTNDSHTGNALYTHLADASGLSLATTDNNREITRSLSDTSFIFSGDGQSYGNYGSMIISSNRFRLPKSSITFKNGDVVRFAMGELGDRTFTINDAFGVTPAPAGVLQVTATVRYREVETEHVQFELLVDADTSEWFNPDIGFTNFDPSQFNSFDNMTSKDYKRTVAEAPGGYAYLHDNCGSHLPTVTSYYSAFADPNGFGATSLTLNPGPYPLDLRFYQGSLANDSSFTTVAVFQDYDNTVVGGYNDISFEDAESPISVNNVYGTVRGTDTRVLVGYTIALSANASAKVGFDSDNSFFIVNPVWDDDVNEINDFVGQTIDVSFYTTGMLPLDVSNASLVVGTADGPIGNFHLATFDVSVAYDPLESLTVALRDSNNLNIDSTKNAGNIDYHFRSGFIKHPKILFMVDNCLTTGSIGGPSENLQSMMTGIRQIVADICTNTGVAPTTAVIGYGDGVNYPIYSGYTAGAPAHVVGSVLKDLEAVTTVTEWEDDDYSHLIPAATSFSNYWKALKDYVTLEAVDTCISTVFAEDLDAIVLFNYGDVSASKEQRDMFDACSNFFSGVTRIAVTDTNNDITELLSFTGTADNIYRLAQNGVLANNALVQTLSKRLGAVPHIGSNALHVHTTDARGSSQAATRTVSDARSGDVALYYALSDSCGAQLNTTKSTNATTGLNAMYVSLVTKVNGQGAELEAPSTINSDRPLHITFDTAFHEGKSFDFTVSGHLVTVADLSNNNVNIKHIGIANETPAPIWLKIYDMSVGYYIENSGAVLNESTGTLDASAFTLQSKLVYNLAVPGTDYRDLEFIKGVKFNEGVYMIASTNYRYDTFDFPPGSKHIYVHGSYEDITEA